MIEFSWPVFMMTGEPEESITLPLPFVTNCRRRTMVRRLLILLLLLDTGSGTMLNWHACQAPSSQN
jgi:hypothetical protein